MNEIKQIESALNIAANRGCFNLQDSAILFQALKRIEAELSRLDGAKEVQTKDVPGTGPKRPKK